MSEVLSKYDKAYNQTLGEKLRVFEELRPVLAEESIHCPGEEAIELNALVLIGSQATGKSSVLEGITDIFFPKQYTRTPVILHLQVDPHINKNSISVAGHADFRGARHCQNMDELQQVLRGIAEEVQRSGVPVRNEPIHVRYVRKTGPVMTLVDLPGICHYDRTGYNIAKATVSMANEYATMENMIMLVVCSATDEFGTQAFSIAKKNDSKGNRTIGVATMAEKVETGSRIFLQQMRMEGRSNPTLRHGFIAIRNRLEEEVNEHEREGFESVLSTHPLLAQLDWSQKGFNALAKKIVHAQSNVVDDFIVNATEEIKKKIQEVDEELKMGGNVIEDQERQLQVVNDDIQKTKGDLGVVGDEIQKTEVELKTITDHIHMTENRLALVNGGIQEKKSKLENANKQILKKSNQISHQGNKLSALEDELRRIRDRIQKEERELNNVDDQLQAIEVELQRVSPDEDNTKILEHGLVYVQEKFKLIKTTLNKRASRKEEKRLKALTDRIEKLEANLKELMNTREEN